jgi:DNA-binding transcriptional MerR regulator
VAPKGESEVYKPAEACRIAEVAPYVLRYWETEFTALSEGRDKASSKLYTARDVRIISRIRELLYDEGFTVAGAKKRLDAEIAEGRFDSGLAPAPPLASQRGADKDVEKAPQKAAAPPAPAPATRPAEAAKAPAPIRAPEKPAAPAPVPARPAEKAAAPRPAPAPAPAAASPAPRPAEPGLDRKMVVRELKEIVRLLNRA